MHVGDLAATIYNAFGIDPGQTLYDSLEQPHTLAQGKPLRDLLV